MTDVIIAGIGQAPVGEHWELSLRNLSAKAITAAMHDAGDLRPQAMYIGNFLAPVLSHQSNLGAMLTDNSGLEGIEGYTVEAAGASGGGALRMGYMAIASGLVDVAVVVGIEKYTDQIGSALETAVAQSTDYDYEAVQGVTATSQAALVMQRYMHEYNVPHEAFAGFAMLAHANAVHNPNAMFHKAITAEQYARGATISSPLNIYDAAPYADGAAALILARADRLPADFAHPKVRVSGSAVAIDTLALHDRHDPLAFTAASVSVDRACRNAGVLPGDADLFELCDAFSIYAALSLEAAGFAERGQGWRMAQDDYLGIHGELPISTMGGLKGRGNPLGAAGVYQAIEAVQQLRGQAGENQVAAARLALVQSLGGPASTAVTHVLERVE